MTATLETATLEMAMLDLDIHNLHKKTVYKFLDRLVCCWVYSYTDHWCAGTDCTLEQRKHQSCHFAIRSRIHKKILHINQDMY